MRVVQFSDRENKIIMLALSPDNTINRRYFKETFPGALSIRYKFDNSDRYIIPFNADGNYSWDWDSNVIYEVPSSINPILGSGSNT
ncbi:hypothetical protein I4U23_000467 [Adineta vaga]|nr:hypothetical protein I4U23_000467 [Adineta vaga]